MGIGRPVDGTAVGRGQDSTFISPGQDSTFICSNERTIISSNEQSNGLDSFADPPPIATLLKEQATSLVNKNHQLSNHVLSEFNQKEREIIKQKIFPQALELLQSRVCFNL